MVHLRAEKMGMQAVINQGGLIMEIHDTLVYVSMIITVGISMIILTTVENFKNIFLTPQIKNVIYYLLSVFLVTVFQWALGGAIFFLYNKVF